MEVAYEHRFTELEDRTKSNTKRLDDLEKKQSDLTAIISSVQVVANEQEHIKSDVTEIKNDVKELKDKPGKRWEEIVNKVIWAVIAAIGAFVLGYLGF